jgi:SpoVK/Ycf46/Vps4 family AAA+-type ATPase
VPFELASYLAANYPYLGLRTHEEARACRLLEAIAGELFKRFEAFTLPPTGEPVEEALSALERVAANGAAQIFALCDFHPALHDPRVVRALRELQPSLESRGQSLVLVAPSLEVPAEIAEDTLVFDLPLPDAELLGQLLQRTLESEAVALEEELKARAVRAARGMTLSAARRAFRRGVRGQRGLKAGSLETILEEKRLLLARTELLEPVDELPPIDAVGGLAALKEWLAQREAAFSDRARSFGLPAPKGLLLVGVQGCGKSLTAKAVARLWNLPLVRLDFGALFTAGRSPEQNLRRVQRLVGAMSPVVLWIDEIDKAFRTLHGGGGSEVLSRVFGSFLTWLQEKREPVFVVATANEVETLPPELTRKGRFDEIFFIDLPEVQERQQILAIHVAAHGRKPERFDLLALAQGCEHFAGSELEQVVITGLYRAFRHGRELSDDDLRGAAQTVVPLYRTYEEPIKALREWAKGRARRASPEAKLTAIWQGD